jgi:hypothetical protein
MANVRVRERRSYVGGSDELLGLYADSPVYVTK